MILNNKQSSEEELNNKIAKLKEKQQNTYVLWLNSLKKILILNY